MGRDVPVESCDFLGGGEHVGVLCGVAEEVEYLAVVVILEEVLGCCHNL